MAKGDVRINIKVDDKLLKKFQIKLIKTAIVAKIQELKKYLGLLEELIKEK